MRQKKRPRIFFFHTLDLPISDVAIVLQVTSGGKVVTWTVTDPMTLRRDDFPNTEGPAGTKGNNKGQVQVLRGAPPSGDGDGLLALWLRLYPGDMDTDLAKINAEYRASKRQITGGRHIPITKYELMKCIGLMHAARLFSQRGRQLWTTTTLTGMRSLPEFGRFMTNKRFDEIRKNLSFAFADKAVSAVDPWWRMRSGINGFNSNRLATIITSECLVADELMSGWIPQTTAFGGLPNISFVKRKPKPLGTEFKNICDGSHGVMLFIEVQEGKVRMRAKRFSAKLGGNAAVAMRIALGTVSGFE